MTRWVGKLEPIDDYRYRISPEYKTGMRVPGIIYTSPGLLDAVNADDAPDQVANVATLPGIVGASLAMPDIHWGYGFCIGGVAATDPKNGGVISPGGVGYDINCGVRLLRTNLQASDVAKHIETLTQDLYRRIPAGVGKGGKYKYRSDGMKAILNGGARAIVAEGLGRPDDLEFCEAGGGFTEANASAVSDRAMARGDDQCGTLGSGNHFIELQQVTDVFDAHVAEIFGLHRGQLVVMIHSGSRGLGYQVCDDSIAQLRDLPKKLGIDLPDRQLVCAPVDSPEGQRYLAAMRSAANFAWANRQLLMHLVRETFAHVLGRSDESFDLSLVYDVAHNIAKMEEHVVAGQRRTLCVHRKGATRAFPAGHAELPARYRSVGQPVLIPGDMGRASYVLVGQPRAMDETFGSACHGAGRRMSRAEAIRQAGKRSIADELRQRGVFALAHSRESLAEEQPDAYKDVSEVVDAIHGAGIASRVVKMKPLGVIKG